HLHSNLVHEETKPMTEKPYGLICPISKACEMLEPRWTVQILTELWNGSTRFNEIRRGVGHISPGLLSKRLRELEINGLVERVEDTATGHVDYIRTQKAIDLEPALNALAVWAQRNIEANAMLCDSDASALMWGLRRKVVVDEFPLRRVVIRFHLKDAKPPMDKYWMMVQPGAEVELCISDPGFDVDIYVETSVRSLGGVFNGRTTYAREIDSGALFLSGDARLARTIDRWLERCEYAEIDGILTLPREAKAADKGPVAAAI
ncbi:MAG: winged helix-turn-helix transcriptional regulator, partial [Paracoccaceae bacterium]